MTELVVSRTEDLSSSFRRITLAGEGLESFDYLGFDQMVRLFFPRDDQRQLRMPTVSNDAWLAQFLLQPKSRRPWVRNYTVRRFRRDSLELDIDFVRHRDGGPASAWAERVQPGTPAGIFDEGMCFLPPDDIQWQLLIGDESAVPAVLAILETAPDDMPAAVYLEVPHADDVVTDVSAPAGTEMHWVVRDNDDEVPGTQLAERIRDARLRDGKFYTWVAGEQKLATGVRRHLVNDRSVPKSDIYFSGYWRYGKSAPG
ncbi:siderophore-interacting protein [Gordonia sp. MP11Mi]